MLLNCSSCTSILLFKIITNFFSPLKESLQSAFPSLDPDLLSSVHLDCNTMTWRLLTCRVCQRVLETDRKHVLQSWDYFFSAWESTWYGFLCKMGLGDSYFCFQYRLMACDYDLLFSTFAGNSLGKNAVQINLWWIYLFFKGFFPTCHIQLREKEKKKV